MPVYDSADWDSIKDVWPSRVLDANGTEIPWVHWCDTDTGETRSEARAPDGTLVLNAAGDGIAVIRSVHPAPLRLERIERADMETVPLIVQG